MQFKADGQSLARMAKTSDGDGALIMSGGEASALALLLTNLDLAGVVPLVIGAVGRLAHRLPLTRQAWAAGPLTGDGVTELRGRVAGPGAVRA
mgnify:CR=1 FL=1